MRRRNCERRHAQHRSRHRHRRDTAPRWHAAAALRGLWCRRPPWPTASRRAPAAPPVECGDLPFLIRRDGTWLYRGSPIGRKELVCLFSSVLKRDEDGGFWLETPAERGRIEVEDAPFLAVELDWTGCGRDQVLTFRTNVDELITAGPGASDPHRARPADLRADALSAGAAAAPGG